MLVKLFEGFVKHMYCRSNVSTMYFLAFAFFSCDNEQSKASSSSSAAASHSSSTSQKQQVPQEQKEQQQKFIQQNQLQTEQLQKLFQIPDSQPKKRAYSSPAPYLSSPSSMGKGTPKGEVQENGVLSGGEVPSSKRMEKVKSLTLSDIKAPTSSGKKEFCQAYIITLFYVTI